MKVSITKILSLAVILHFSNVSIGQCLDTLNIYSFTHSSTTYEVVTENKTWENAAICATERGGYLAEINDIAEQNAIFSELSSNPSILVNNTVAPDGGDGSYVWIGGNDLSAEGNWVWDGNNDGTGEQFWMGDFNGTSVGGLYNNWGDEPDDFEGQDGLGLSLNGWPFGVPGEWNDVDHTNTLYFVIEYPTTVGTNDLDILDGVSIYPNPVTDYLIVETDRTPVNSLIIFNSIGQQIKNISFENNSSINKIDLSNLNNGIYVLKIISNNGNSVTKKLIK